MLRFVIEAQALPVLVWALVAQSVVLVAVVVYLPLQRMLLQRQVGEALGRSALELLEEVAPSTGILGTVCGLIFSMTYVGEADGRELILRGLATALYTTAYGLVLFIGATTMRHLYPWRRS